jgi:hypothetical protein
MIGLAQEADDTGRSVLRSAGLESSSDGLVWTGVIDRSSADLTEVTGELQDAGLVVDEIRLREPGLRGVFFRLAGREIDA